MELTQIIDAFRKQKVSQKELQSIIDSKYEHEINSAGTDLEHLCRWALREKFPYLDITGTEEDLYNGTDFLIQAKDVKGNIQTYRVDFTLDFEGKDHTNEIGDYNTKEGIFLYITYGIRTRNNMHPFETPVLVIGIKDTAQDLLRRDWAPEAFRNNIQKIIQKGIDLYDLKLCLEKEIQQDPTVIGDYQRLSADIQKCAAEAATAENAQEVALCLPYEQQNIPIEKLASIQRILCEKDGLCIEFFPDVLESVQMAAIRQNPEAYELIPEPCERAQEYMTLMDKTPVEAMQELYQRHPEYVGNLPGLIQEYPEFESVIIKCLRPSKDNAEIPKGKELEQIRSQKYDEAR